MRNDKPNLIVDKTFQYALKVLDYSEKLYEMKRFSLADQIIRSGTSIGANVWEAQNAESKADFIHKMKIAAKEGASLIIPCKVEMPEQYETFIRSHPSLSVTIRIGVFNKRGWQKDIFTILSLRKMVDDKKFDLTINPGLMKGKYYLRFSIQNGIYNSTHNSDKIELVVE